MRILVMASEIVSSAGMSGGPKHFLEVSKRWRDVGHEIHVLVSRVGYELCRKHGLNANYHVLPSSGERGVILSYILRILRSSRWNPPFPSNLVIYSMSDSLCNTCPATLMKIKNPRNLWVANVYHIIPPPLERGGRFVTNLISLFAQRLSFLLIRRYADLVFVLNNVIIEKLVKLGFPRNRLHVVGAGINSGQIERAPRAQEAIYDACYLGRLEPEKGIPDLVEIWKLVVSKRRNARLAVISIGQKERKSALIKKIKEENLESNFFILPLAGDKALSIMKASKIFVFPSHTEGWGIAICEAMACGLPVVAYDLPVYREIFTQGMIRIPINEIEQFSEEVLKLLEDNEKRRELSEDGMALAKKYDWNDVAVRELSLITKKYVLEE